VSPTGRPALFGRVGIRMVSKNGSPDSFLGEIRTKRKKEEQRGTKLKCKIPV